MTLIQNAQYTFEFTVDNVDVLADFSGGYPGGSPFQDGIEYDTVDLNFEVSLESSTLSQDAFSNNLKVTIFPNPFDDYIKLETCAKSYLFLKTSAKRLRPLVTGRWLDRR